MNTPIPLPSKQEIENVIAETFYGKSYEEKRGQKIPYVRKLGNNSWEIFSGESILRCNDAGKAMFDQALQDWAKKI